MLAGTAASQHPEHFPTVLGHAIGGTAMLWIGAANLYVGATRRGFAFHKPLGYAYLISGAVGAGAGLALSIVNAHPPYSIGVATGTLAAAWLAVAAMAYRAARHRRIDAHRDWMIRSYVLTWTFVFCRIVMRFEPLGALGAEGVTATIWASWIVPLLVCELALQWSRTSRTHRTQA